MRKELIWAAIIGISFGLVIAFGAWRVRSSVTPKSDLTVATPSPAPAPGQLRIAINKPNNLDVVTEVPTNVTGITNPLTWVVVSTDSEDYLTQSQNDGSFSIDVDLSPGLNHIKASSVNAQGSSVSQDILTVYSSSFKENLATSESSENNTSSESALTLKLAKAGNPPKAYIGTVTDIIDSTIQIKSTDSQIQQIATNSQDLSVVNSKGSTNKSVKLTDIAIGDFIVAMGYIDGNEVLDAQRILITDSPLKSQIAISMQNVKEVSKKALTLSPAGGAEENIFTPDKNTTMESYSAGKVKSVKITDFSKSDLVITVSDTTGQPSLPRAIFNLGN